MTSCGAWWTGRSPRPGRAAPGGPEQRPDASHVELARRTALVQLGLQALRSVEPGPDYEARLAAAERQLLALLLGSPSMSRRNPPPDQREALDDQ